jgi:site-specific recombinase XerD
VPIPTPQCTPIFDNLPFILKQQIPSYCPSFAQEDFLSTQNFLLRYRNNAATFNAYRRETERFLQWAWNIHKRSILTFKGRDIEAYLNFCKNPLKQWIGTRKVPRFMEKSGKRIPNPLWHPFVATVSKAACRKGKQPNPDHYLLSRKSLREVLTVIGSLYQLIIQEGMISLDPTKQIRQKSYYFESQQYQPRIRRLSDLQWDYVMETAQMMAYHAPEHERTLFIITALYGLYLRISELSASPRWTPTMGDFQRDSDGLWWFITVGKGNKKREITVSDELLQALKQYRLALGLTPLPTQGESTPLIPKQRGKGPIRSTSQIRMIVQRCFDHTIARLRQDGLSDEADVLLEATVHWLRHTGISDDVKHRPREHVRDDAGHSAKIIDTYLDTTRRERHASGKSKRIRPEEFGDATHYPE